MIDQSINRDIQKKTTDGNEAVHFAEVPTHYRIELNEPHRVRWFDLLQWSSYIKKMKIKPTDADFRSWTYEVPDDGDLLFFNLKNTDQLKELPGPVLTVSEAKAHSLTHWNLSQRSWYSYALNRASHCAWLPRGGIEQLDRPLQTKIAKSQIRLEVPTLVASSHLSGDLKKILPAFGKYHWLTSATWKKLSVNKRIAALKEWYTQNEVSEYESLSFKELPEQARRQLKRVGFDSLLNRYASCSGPNCFAAVTGAIATNQSIALAKQWLHWEPLAKFLIESNFVKTKAKEAKQGDVLIFSRGKQVVHAAYYLGDGIYFEKPGQDFYEPYRVERLVNWQREWPDTTLTIWRLSPSES